MLPGRRSAWAAGVVFVVALVAEAVISVGVGVNQDDSAARIAKALADHDERLLLVAYLSVIYAAAFVVYLAGLHDLLRERAAGARLPGSLVLVGGTLQVTLHATSDIGITGLLGAKLASYGAAHDQGLSYMLYLLTFAVDSVGDVFGSLFLWAAGVLALRTGLLPRRLAWLAIVAAVLLFLQGFLLGGVVSALGLLLDGIGFVLFLVFVLLSSIVLLRRPAVEA